MRPQLAALRLWAVALVGAAFVDVGARALSAPPTHTLDLDAPAGERWRGAVASVLAAHPWEHSFGPVFAAHNATLYGNLTDEQWVTLANAVKANFPDTAAELDGIAADFASAGHPVTFAYLAGWVYFHELAHTDLAAPDVWAARSCTGLVVDSAAAGSRGPVHVANMDQTPETVRNITLRVQVVRGGVAVAEGVDWYWLTTGMSRMVRRGVASVQENWRTIGKAPQPHAATLEAIARGVVPQILVFRRELLAVRCADAAACDASDGGFAQFVAAVRSVELAAPFYVIAAGAASGEGVVIARSNAGVDSEVWLGSKGGAHGAAGQEGWYVVQTNYDQCRPVPPGVNATTAPCHPLPDSSKDPRRTAAVATLTSLGPGLAGDAAGALAVLSSFPVHNPDTAYTAVMSAAVGSMSAYVRTAMCPEPGTVTVTVVGYCGVENRTAAGAGRGWMSSQDPL